MADRKTHQEPEARRREYPRWVVEEVARLCRESLATIPPEQYAVIAERLMREQSERERQQ